MMMLIHSFIEIRGVLNAVNELKCNKKNTVTHIGNLSTKTGMEFYFIFFVTFGHNFLFCFASLFNVFFLSMMFGKFLVNSLNHHQSIILYWLIMFELIFLFFLSKFEMDSKKFVHHRHHQQYRKFGWSSKKKFEFEYSHHSVLI